MNLGKVDSLADLCLHLVAGRILGFPYTCQGRGKNKAYHNKTELFGEFSGLTLLKHLIMGGCVNAVA